MITQRYNLNLIPDTVPVIVNCSQYDALSRTIEMVIYDGSSLYEIPTGTSASVRGTKQDNTGFEYLCTIDGSVVSFDIQDQMTIFAGRVPCEIRLADANGIIGTCNFLLNVEETPLDPDVTISETDLPLLEEAEQNAIRAENAADRAEQILSSTVKSVNGETPDANGNVDVMDFVSSPTANDILLTDANGQAIDSGRTLSEFQELLTADAGINITSEGVISNRFANLTGIDLDTVKYNCIAWANDACTNKPSTYGGMLLSCFSTNNSNSGAQIFATYATTGRGVYYRRCNSGTFSDWTQIVETLSSGTQTVEGTYCTVVTNWVKEGNICSVYGRVTPSSDISSSTGNITVSNLPNPSTYTFFTAGTSANSWTSVNGRLTSSSVFRFSGAMTNGTVYYFNFSYYCS